jgi:oxygen-dependent protoporphyrinogen oxidase
VATELVGAFLTGVYAGDERELGIEAVFPSLAELESSHGSLLLGGLMRAFGSRRTEEPLEPARRGTWSSPSGLGGLAAALAAGLPDPVRLQTRVTSLGRDGSLWRVELSDGGKDVAVAAEQVVVATPAYAASELLASVEPEAAKALAAIEYAPIVALGLGVDPGDVRGDIEGFGFIVPRAAGASLLGCLFMSRLFEGRAPAGRELLHCMLGGVRTPGIVDQPDDAVVEAALADLDRALGLKAPPRTVALQRWKRAIPQPGRAHVRRVAEVMRRVHALPGLTLAGSYVAGVSVADTLASGTVAAGRLAEGRS